MTPVDFIKFSFLLFVFEDNIFYIRASDFVRQQFRRTPQNQTAIIGETVTLACSVTNIQGELQWTRDGFGLGTDRSLKEYDRYRMIGNEEEGDYTLVIDHVTLEDDAIFQCQVGPPWPLRSPSVKLTVEIPTGEPEILQGDYLQTTEGRLEEVECISRGGKPPAEITWSDAHGRPIQGSLRLIKDLQDDGKSFNTRSILTFIPQKEMNNKTLICHAHNRPSKEIMSDSIRLNVRYYPEINLQISNQIKEQDDVEIRCEAEGNPAALKYRWFLNNQAVGGESSNVLQIRNISRLYHESLVTCEVSNTMGKSDETETILVNYGPTFIRKPENIQADLFTEVTLYCFVEGYPQPDIAWFHEDTRNIIGTSSNLTVAVGRDTIGKYLCRASAQGFPDISTESQIFLKGPPRIESSKIQFGEEEGLTNLDCYAISIPRANTISWNHGEGDVRDDENYSLSEEYTDVGVKSTLIIKAAKSSDFGPYNCTVTNPYGKCVMEIFLVKNKNPQVVVILIPIIAIVVGIIAITMLMLLCQRRRPRRSIFLRPSKLESEKNTITNQFDVSFNNSTTKVELPTDNSSSIGENSSEYGSSSNACCTLTNRNDSIRRYRNISMDPDIFASIKNAGHTKDELGSYKRSTNKNQPVESGNTNRAKQTNFSNTNVSASNGNPFLETSSTAHPRPRSNILINNISHPSSTHSWVHEPNNSVLVQGPPRRLQYSSQIHPQHHLKPGTLDTHV